MPDPRWETLAEILLNHSTRLKAGETLLIECFDLEDDTLPRLWSRRPRFEGPTPCRDQEQPDRPRPDPPCAPSRR